MSKKSIVLSISILISGKEDMPKCLKSLHFFKDSLPCEIILVDTGCNAEQRALAEQYADKILDFAWCNDFAAARNVGLKAASGEWFLYLDDDEWFDNPTEIVDFFVSGEYQQYNSATYKVRNYFNRQGTIYDDNVVTRLIKLEKETIFVGKIHEYLFPFKVPTKHFTDFVHHYGYAYRNDEEKQKHACRNIAPLLEMVKEEPEEIRWACQLAQEYFALDQYSETVKVCENVLEHRKLMGNRNGYEPAWLGAIYGFGLISLESERKYSEEEKWLEKALAEPAMPEATRAFFYFAGIRLYSLSGTKEYEKCRNCVRQYVNSTNRLRNNKEMLANDTALITTAVFQEHRLYPALLLGMEALIQLEDYSLAEEAFSMIDWSDRRMLHQNEMEKKIVDACCSVSYHPLWAKVLQTLVSREEGIKEMYAVFLEMEILYTQQNESDKISRLHRLVAELDYEHCYILCIKILWTELNPDITSEEVRRQVLSDLFVEVFEKYFNELFEIRTEVWNVAQRKGILIEPMLLKADYRRWREKLETWSATAELIDLQQWDRRIVSWKQQSDIRYDLFGVKCMEGYLRHYHEICSSQQQLEQILWKYADNVLAFYQFYYKEFVFKKMPELLPEDAQLALKLKELQQYQDKGNEKSALECLRKCLGLYPTLENVVEDYAKMYRDALQKRNQEALAEQMELFQLVNSLKKVARLYLEKKEYQEAQEILLQVRQCAPEDREVNDMLEEADIGLKVENDI